MASQSNTSTVGQRLGALAVFVAVILVLAGVAAGGAYWGVSALTNGLKEAATPAQAGAYGACDEHSPWSCRAVPQRTVENRFGQTVPDDWTVLTAEAEPIAAVSDTPQIQVLLEAPAGSDVSSWLALVDDVHTTATTSEAPPLKDLGMTSVRGGTRDFTKVYSGDYDDHIYVWAYKHL